MKLTEYLAIYAASLSTITLVWNIINSRPRVKVDVVVGTSDVDGKTQLGVYIIARNISSHDVHLSSVSFLYSYKDASLIERLAHIWKFRRIPRRINWVHSSLAYYSIESGCPIQLEARTSHRVFIPIARLEEMLSKTHKKQIIAHVQDQLWNDFYSKPFNLPQPKSEK